MYFINGFWYVCQNFPFFFPGLYDSECIIVNPWFEEPAMECIWCEEVKNIETFNDTANQELISEYLRQARPMIFKVFQHNVLSNF